MPPVKTVASSTDVDNEATAELPVLDVAAYEATLDDADRQHRHLERARGRRPAADATAQLPALAERSHSHAARRRAGGQRST